MGATHRTRQDIIPHTPTSQPTLLHNVAWNFLGIAVPMLLGILVIPVLARQLHADRFGVLSLAWTVLGYFAFFDLGLSRAVVKLAAEKIGHREGPEQLGLLYGTASRLLVILGMTAGLAMALASFWLVGKGLKVDVAMRFEVQVAFLLLALSLPPTIMVMAPIGMLVAHQRFDLINKVRVPMTLLVYVGPATISFFTPSLAVIIGFMAGTRFVNLLILTLLFKNQRVIQEHPLFDWKMVCPLLHYGGWMTVVHLISPLLLSLDRFMIGVILSASSVAYYAAPSEALVRLWSIPGAIVGVLFPALAALIVSDATRTNDLFELGVKSIYILMFPVTLGVVLFAPEVLQAWLGHDYHARSTAVMQIIAVGVYVYSINHMPAELINAAGRPRFTAVVRLLELPPYLLLTWWLILKYGIEGAAASWLIRILIDTFVLFIASDRILQGSWRTGTGMLVSTGTGAVLLFLGIAIGSPFLGVAAPFSVKLAYSLISLIVVLYVFFVTWVDRDERAFIACLLRRNLLWKPSN